MGITIEQYLRSNFPDRSIIDNIWVYDNKMNPTTAKGNAIIIKARIIEHSENCVDIEFFLL